MELLVKAIEGPYALLLVFQVIIITCLFMTLLWMAAQRVRYASDLGDVSYLASTDVHASLARIAELHKEIEELAAGNEKLKRLAASAIEMEKKIKFLESRLLEYEILQEEIGTLSALKLENEKLKESLVAAEGKLSGVDARAAAAVTAISVTDPVATTEVTAASPPVAFVDDSGDQFANATRDQLTDLLSQIDDISTPKAS